MTILGISCFYHDSAAALIRDGSVVAAAAEERFSRVKHDNRFPGQAIRFCLEWAGLKMSDLDGVVFYEKPIRKFDRIFRQQLQYFPRGRKTFVDAMGPWAKLKFSLPSMLKDEFGYTGALQYVGHHLSHAASSYYLSPFTSAAIVTLDGVGEWTTTAIGRGNGAGITLEQEIQFPHSLGLLYSALTSYLGFSVNDAEYKVMGLAAYGDPAPFRETFKELIRTFPDGSYALNLEYFDYGWSERMFSGKLERLFGHPKREPESPMERHYENIAASLQEALEDTVFNLLSATYRRTKNPNLCLSGGVALNSVLNGKILSRTPFKQLYIHPDPGDAGGAVGAALYAYYLGRQKKERVTFSPALGPSYTDEQVEDIIRGYNLPYRRMENRDVLLEEVSGRIASQQVVGWFQGRMEWGPRALGHRSILAAANTAKMKDIINTKVKHRELFRPFAPVIPDKYVNDYFLADKNLSVSADYMLMVYPFKEKRKPDVPSVVHVDGTGRLQVIRHEDNPLYYDLIESYKKKSGIPIIINTSFNVRGEPIVCTPHDAIPCFLKTDIDCLVMGPYLVTKPKNRT